MEFYEVEFWVNKVVELLDSYRWLVTLLVFYCIFKQDIQKQVPRLFDVLIEKIKAAKSIEATAKGVKIEAPSGEVLGVPKEHEQERTLENKQESQEK